MIRGRMLATLGVAALLGQAAPARSDEPAPAQVAEQRNRVTLHVEGMT